MAERNKSQNAIILTVKEFGENNRIANYLCEEGIFSAVLYGGPKSKLRSLVQPFYSGTIYIYSDNVKKSTKITDFDAKNCHLSFRTNLFKSWAANLAAEIVMKTKCGGDSKLAFLLLNSLLDGMEACDENESRLGLLRFIWRYLGLLGIQPDAKECVSCGNFLLSTKLNSAYIESKQGFVCDDCLPFFPTKEKDESAKFIIDVNGLTYLAAINELSPGKVRSLLLPSASAFKLKQLLYHLIEKACETKLDSLESGMGIL